MPDRQADTFIKYEVRGTKYELNNTNKNFFMETTNQLKRTKYLNPYIGGVLLGLVLLAANFIAGRGLGASGAIKSVVVASTQVVAPKYAEGCFLLCWAESFSAWALN